MMKFSGRPPVASVTRPAVNVNLIIVDATSSLGRMVTDALHADPRFEVEHVQDVSRRVAPASLVIVDKDTSEERRARLARRAPLFMLGRDIALDCDISVLCNAIAASCTRTHTVTEDDWLAADPGTQTALRIVRAAAPHWPNPALICGKAGTGKESLAWHFRTTTSSGPFVLCHPGQNLERMAAAARGGILFLQELEGLTHADEKILMGILPKRPNEPGSTPPAVRVVAATQNDPKQRFHHDLYYRLAETVIELSPLRERPADLAALIDRFRARHKRGTVVYFGRDTIQLLLRHSWPGNLRELKHAMDRVLGNAPAGTLNARTLVTLVPALSPRRIKPRAMHPSKDRTGQKWT